MFQPQALQVMQTLSSQIGFLNLQLAEKGSIITQQNARIQELEQQLEQPLEVIKSEKSALEKSKEAVDKLAESNKRADQIIKEMKEKE
jgi:hypothetical protein